MKRTHTAAGRDQAIRRLRRLVAGAAVAATGTAGAITYALETTNHAATAASPGASLRSSAAASSSSATATPTPAASGRASVVSGGS